VILSYTLQLHRFKPRSDKNLWRRLEDECSEEVFSKWTSCTLYHRGMPVHAMYHTIDPRNNVCLSKGWESNWLYYKFCIFYSEDVHDCRKNENTGLEMSKSEPKCPEPSLGRVGDMCGVVLWSQHRFSPTQWHFSSVQAKSPFGINIISFLPDRDGRILPLA